MASTVYLPITFQPAEAR